jgi:hypothetical protein
MRGEAFALTSLQDRTLGSTIAFFFTHELVLCSFDVFQALWMMFDLGPHGADVAAWCVAMRAKAERVVVIPDREIASVRVTFRMIQDQLCIARERSGVSAPGYRAALPPAGERPSWRRRVAAPEVPLHVGEELSIRRMIDGLEPHHSRYERALVLVQVPDELELRRRRPDDEDGVGLAERLHDIAEEPAQVVGVMVLFRRTLLVAMDVGAGRTKRRLVERPGVNVEDAGFLVIDPDGGLMMGVHDLPLRTLHAAGGRGRTLVVWQPACKPCVRPRSRDAKSAVTRLAAMTLGRANAEA